MIMNDDFSLEQKTLDKNYWEERWENQLTGWDIGYSSPAIEEYILQYPNKEASILIPGCGNAYEVEFLWNLGFTNITILDISTTAVQILRDKYQNKKGVTVICEDFFNHQGKYDLIIEQTFFCALRPELRPEYVKKMRELLDEGGRIVGVLLNRNFEKDGPPFGGSVLEYQNLFNNDFNVQKMEECYNSIPSRKGSEIFLNLKKKI